MRKSAQKFQDCQKLWPLEATRKILFYTFNTTLYFIETDEDEVHRKYFSVNNHLSICF